MRSQLGIFLMYPLVLGLAILTMSNSHWSADKSDHEFSMLVNDSESVFDYSGPLYQYSLGTEVSQFNSPMIPAKGFIAFKEALGFKESRGRYRQVNTLGYLGKYQFGAVTLNHFGVSDGNLFLHSPMLQEQVFVKYLNYNHNYLADYIDNYAGKTVGGIKITESGILAAAHLSGPGGVRKFLNSNGRKASRDAYGSSVKHYMKKFAGYNLDEAIN
ncbi:MAG: peptidoglycan-binding protein LysM [Nonlabens sp.]